jgi:NADH-quinone oxidoreductase subunit G
VGGNLRKDHPLLAQRVRQAARRGAQVHALNEAAADWAMPVANTLVAPSAVWVQALADVATAVAQQQGVTAPVTGQASATATAIANSLLSGERKAILLGNAAAHHAKASSLLAVAHWIAQQTGASVGYLGEAANTVGAQLVQALPIQGGLNANQMLQNKALQALFLLNTEPAFDCAGGEHAVSHLGRTGMVVTLSPFKTNMAFSDVLLPISPFTETAGTFVNTEGRVQSFHGVVKPLAETRPAWKVWRVLGTMLQLPGFEFDTIEQVRAQAIPANVPSRLSNDCAVAIDLTPATVAPVTASIYQLDGLVRRAPALQHTADAQEVSHG